MFGVMSTELDLVAVICCKFTDSSPSDFGKSHNVTVVLF